MGWHNVSLSKHVMPEQLASLACGPDREFLQVYGSAPLLCVDVSRALGGGLAAGLRAASDPKQSAPALGFRTQMGAATARASAPTVGSSVDRLRTWLAGGPHYVLQVTKRSEGFAESRITVGRACNTDIVLRHGSVSKLHAWFELREDGTLAVADAGSKNGTALAGKSLPARVLTPFDWGQVLAFGRVKTFACTAMQLWQALQAPQEVAN